MDRTTVAGRWILIDRKRLSKHSSKVKLCSHLQIVHKSFHFSHKTGGVNHFLAQRIRAVVSLVDLGLLQELFRERKENKTEVKSKCTGDDGSAHSQEQFSRRGSRLRQSLNSSLGPIIDFLFTISCRSSVTTIRSRRAVFSTEPEIDKVRGVQYANQCIQNIDQAGQAGLPDVRSSIHQVEEC